LKRRNALITGSGSSIGQMMAKLFASEGANVAVNALTLERTQGTLPLLPPYGVNIVGIGRDVTGVGGRGEMTKRVIAEFGGLDRPVCNAGTAPCVSLAEMTPAQ
jgi:NAD(P)-dependent dehydrogenase (short-subunit alcohol dehydrogenase family)